MAFALGTSAGAGTISIVAGGSIVTGVGTNFQAANVGAILVVGAQWGVIASRASTTSVTLDRPFATAVTGSAYTISANIPVITQTGTDTSLSTLTGVPGVTTSLNLWTLTSATLVINGSLTINRLTNRLRFLNSASVVTASTTIAAMTVGATGTFNNSVAQSLNGYSYKSGNYAILFDVTIPAIASHSTGSLIGTVLGSTSVFEGDIEFTATLASVLLFGFLGTTTLQFGALLNSNAVGTNYLFYVPFSTGNLTLSSYTSVGISLRVADNALTINNYAATAGPNAININTASAINNPQYVGLQDLGNTAPIRTAAASLKYFQLINFSSSALTPNASLASTTGSQVLFVNQLSLSASGATGAIQDVKFWARDSNNGSRSPTNYGAGLGYEIATTGNLTYTATTAVSGVAPTLNIISVIYWQDTASTFVRDYRGNDSATSQNLNIYQCAYNYSLSNSLTNLYPLVNGIYGGASVRNQGFVLLTDTSVTETDPTIVATYTTLNNNAELYDYAKYYLYTNFAGQTATYVTGAGNAGSYNIIINTAAAAVFNPTSSLIIKTSSFSGNLTTSGSLILAASSVVTNGTFTTPNIIQDIPTALTGVTATGNVNYNTNTAITVTYTDCDIQGTVSNTGSAQVNITLVNSTINTVGSNVVAEQFATISAPNLITGTRVRVYDEDNAVELFNGVLASSGFSQSFVYTADTTVTLTATYTSGATAKLGLSATGIFTATGVTFLNSQSDDTVYNGYAINGSAVTGFTSDYAQTDVNLSMATNFTAANLYAFLIYTQTTEDGIRNFFGCITALDAGNLQINTGVVSIFLDNSTALFIYQTDTIRVFRSDNVYPAKTVTTGGGGIQVNWNSNVYVGTADIVDAVWNAATGTYDTAGTLGEAVGNTNKNAGLIPLLL
jgi:hypothetical protein